MEAEVWGPGIYPPWTRQSCRSYNLYHAAIVGIIDRRQTTLEYWDAGDDLSGDVIVHPDFLGSDVSAMNFWLGTEPQPRGQ